MPDKKKKKRLKVSRILRGDSSNMLMQRRNAVEVFKKLIRREKILDTLNEMAVMFLSQSAGTFGDMMTDGIKQVVDVIDLDKVSVWRNFTRSDGLYLTQVYRWTREAGGTTEPISGLENVSYEKIAPGWDKRLAAGETVNGPVRTLPVADLFRPFGIRSLFITPVFIRNEFWGFVLFQDDRSERCFEDDFVEMMRSAAFLCVNTIIRAEMEHEVTTALRKETAASKAKGEFLSNMSHEMRTPLNAIIGMTTIGRGAADIERKNYALEKVEDASKYLLGLINDILDMSKIEANKLELAPTGFHFEKMLDKVITVVNFRMDEKRQHFSVTVDGKMPCFIVSDEQRLAQVITNLLSNAIKFTPEGGEISLDAALVGEKDGICELRIEVADNGIGILPEQQEHLFEAFTQAESGISRKYGGTGLGLAITKRIVELMGGNIWVSSELGKGARFIFTIKAARGRQTPGQTLNPSIGCVNGCLAKDTGEEPQDGADNYLAGRNLLIAEDVEINREIIISLLEDTGLVIDTASNGREAVDLVAANPGKYDLVFMDVQMPEMDGLEATRRIRGLNLERENRLPIVAMTANVFKDDIENCIAAGMDNHIGKPLDVDEVFRKLRQYIKKRGQ